MSPIVGRHPHHLGAWDPRTAVQVSTSEGTWREPTPEESSALVGDNPAGAKVFTLPTWPSRELATIDWSDGTLAGDATEQSQFGVYSDRVLEFLRFIGVSLADRSEVRLVATTVQSPSPPSQEAPGGMVLVNVGEVKLRVALQQGAGATDPVALVLPTGHGCVLPSAVWPWAVSLGEEGDFGLHLQCAVLPTD